jgi:hypothetical protein
MRIFLAGGLLGVPDWRTNFIKKFEDDDVLIYNPRRENFKTEES